MSTISGSGSTASSAIMTLVQQYLELEREPLTRLETMRSDLTDRRETFTELKSSLRDLRESIDDYRWPGALSPLNQFAATSSDAQSIGVTASGSAAVGQHVLTVESLARAHSIGSAAFTGGDTATVSGDFTMQVTQGGEAIDVEVSLAAGATWREALNQVAAEINSAVDGVHAAVVTTNQLTDEVRLLISSAESGTNELIDAVTDLTGSLAATLDLAGSSTVEAYSANTIQTAANAEFTIDGMAFVAGGNQIDGALSGVTLNLLAVTSSPVTVGVARDVEAVRASVEGFIEGYNELIDFVRDESRPADANGENRGTFAGDLIFMSLRRDLRSMLTDAVGDLGASGALDRLSSIGITADRDGRLTITDAEAFEEALRNNAAEVDQLFRHEEDGIAVRAVGLIDGYVATDGFIANRTASFDQRDKVIDRQIEQMEQRLARREEQLINYFSSLQSMMAEMVAQQESLSQLGG
jgi:flagellar hook-associated protein 2